MKKIGNYLIHGVCLLIFLIGNQNSLRAQTSLNNVNVTHVNPYSLTCQLTNFRESSNFRFVVSLDKNHPYNYGDASVLPFKVTVDFDIEFSDGMGNSHFSNSHSIIIDNANPKGVYFEKINNLGFDVFHAEVSNITYTISTSSPVTDPLLVDLIPDDINVQAFIDVEYRVGIDNPYVGYFLTTNPPNMGSISGPLTYYSNNYMLSWSTPPFCPDLNYAGYQVQVLKLHNIEPTNVSTSTSITVDEFDWENALTMEVEGLNKYVNVTLAEGTGFYVWRVRPIGTLYEGGLANPKNYGLGWSQPIYSPTPASPVTFTTSLIANNNSIFYHVDPEQHLNTIYNRTFTEENKTKESKKYANFLNHLKQSQIYIPSTNKTNVSQTITDYSGRPALSTLPVPISGMRLRYQSSFLKNTSGAPGVLYTAKDYDEDGTVEYNVNDGNGETFSYYNGTFNSNGNVPDAEGNVFNRLLYYNDGTGRIREAASPGIAFKLGNNTTRFFYTTPSETELIKIFGAEAPDPSSVQKTITFDPNNTVTITYTSKEGNVIATCLSESSNENSSILALDNADDALLVLDDVTDNIVQNIETEQGFESIKRLAVAQQTNLDLSYVFDCATASVCGSKDCQYELSIIVRNLDITDDLHADYLYKKYTANDILTTSDCGIPVFDFTDESSNPVTFPATVVLKPGYNYLIQKILIPQETADDISDEAAANASTELAPYRAIVTYWLNKIATDPNYTDADFIYEIEHFNDPPAVPPTTSVDDPTELALFPSGVPADHTLSATPHATLPNRYVITLATPCCGEMEIPMDFQKDFECPDDFTITSHYTANSGNAMDFIGYLNDRNTQCGNCLNISGSIPGYSQQDFNDMIYNMMQPYSCDGGSAVIQYDCEDLWNCWINVVGAAIDQGSSQDGNYDVENGGNGQDGAGDSEFDHFDIFNKIPLKWLFGDLKQKMKDEDNGQQFTFNLVEQFLECTGYVFEDMHAPGTSSPVAGFDYLPFIVDPLNAFKYFEYDPGSSPACEALFCYNVTSPPITPCNPVICATDYTTWNCDERLAFYQCISSETPPQAPEDPQHDPCDPDKTQEEEDKLKAECSNRCSERYTEFREDIIDMLLDNCYVIDECAGAANNVTWDEIDAMANYMVAECLVICDDIDLDCDDLPNPCGSDPPTLPHTYFVSCEADMYRAMTSTLELQIENLCTDPSTPINCPSTPNCDFTLPSGWTTVNIPTN